MQAGFTVFYQRFDYNQARQASILAGTQPDCRCTMQLGTQNLLNYVTNSAKASRLSLSYPLRRSFARVGISYGYHHPERDTLTDAATTYSTYIELHCASTGRIR